MCSALHFYSNRILQVLNSNACRANASRCLSATHQAGHHRSNSQAKKIYKKQVKASKQLHQWASTRSERINDTQVSHVMPNSCNTICTRQQGMNYHPVARVTPRTYKNTMPRPEEEKKMVCVILFFILKSHAGHDREGRDGKNTRVEHH